MIPSSRAGRAGVPPTAAGTPPELSFRVEGARPKIEAATPTLDFRLAVDAAGAAVRSLVLDVQVKLVVSARPYRAETRLRLAEVMGEAGGRNTVGSLFWSRVVVTAPPFEGQTRIDLPVPCTYDSEVAVAKWFQAVDDGSVPVELLFSGYLFWSEGGALRTARIPWDREARYDLPVAVWRELMDRHFPGASWLRLGPDAFARLARYKAIRSLPTWDAALDELLDGAESS